MYGNRGGYGPPSGGSPYNRPPPAFGPPPHQHLNSPYGAYPPPPQRGNYPPVMFDPSRPPPGYTGPPMGPSGNNSFQPPPRNNGYPQAPGQGGMGGPGIGAGGPGAGVGGGVGREPPKGPNTQLSLFVGSISPGITDLVLEQLLNACGPLRTLKRVKNATGKPQAFGFAEYEDPDSVLRALAVLNGVELPDMETRGLGKKLLVKADDKTRTFLNEYEQMMSRSESDDALELSAIKSITAVLEALTQGLPLPSLATTSMTGANSLPAAALPGSEAAAAATPSTSSSTTANPDPSLLKPSPSPNPNLPQPPSQQPHTSTSTDPYSVPAHLHDLSSDELPEASREVVLDQIASFRLQSFEREKAKKALEEDKERRRIELMVQNQSAMKAREAAAAAAGAGGGKGGPGGMREKELALQKGREREREKEQAFIRGGGGGGGDMQSYNRPVGFVAAGKERERTDEEEEEARVERRRRDMADSLKERERRTDARERQLFQKLDRESQLERQRAADEDKEYFVQRDRLGKWDDEEQEERGRDFWFTDRNRWRSQRLVSRRTEQTHDAADRTSEAHELAQLEIESAAFLERQMVELAELAVKQKAAGILTEETSLGPIKLSIGPGSTAASGSSHHNGNGLAGSSSSGAVAAGLDAKKPVPSARKAFVGDDDDDEDHTKKKRTLVKLDYGDGLTVEEREAKRKEGLRLIRTLKVPKSKESLFAWEVKWEAITETILQSKLDPLIRRKLLEYLGQMDDDDLLTFALDQIREKQPPSELMEGVEPVLEEEAIPFTIAVWRALVYESIAWSENLDTTGTTVDDP